MSETVVSSVLSVTGTPARCEAGQRMVRDGRHDPGLPVRGRAQVERHAAGDQLGAQRRVVDRARTVGDPLRVDRERATDLRRAAPLAGVDGDPQAAGARGLERRGVDERVRERRLGAGQVPAGQPLVAEAGGGLGEADVRLGVVRAQRRADQPDDRPGPMRARPAAPATDGRDPVGQRQPAARRGAAAPSGSRRSGRRRPPSSRPARR